MGEWVSASASLWVAACELRVSKLADREGLLQKLSAKFRHLAYRLHASRAWGNCPVRLATAATIMEPCWLSTWDSAAKVSIYRPAVSKWISYGNISMYFAKSYLTLSLIAFENLFRLWYSVFSLCTQICMGYMTAWQAVKIEGNRMIKFEHRHSTEAHFRLHTFNEGAFQFRESSNWRHHTVIKSQLFDSNIYNPSIYPW